MIPNYLRREFHVLFFTINKKETRTEEISLIKKLAIFLKIIWFKIYFFNLIIFCHPFLNWLYIKVYSGDK